jgi:hypothetical protein
MERRAALKLTIDLLHFPSQVRSLRSAPLPDGVSEIIRVAAGDEKAIERAVRAVGRSNEEVREAAEFYVEQVLLYPGADSYRVLGANPDASYDELRRSMALLLRWLHPDGGRHSERSVFASRVTDAWNDLKTKDRRDAYDRLIRRGGSERLRSASGKSIHARQRKPIKRKRAVRGSGAAVPVYNWRQPYDHVFARRDAGIFRRLLRLFFNRFVY